MLAAPAMQGLKPNPEFLALLPELSRAGIRRVFDAGCGVGRQLLPLVQHGFQVVGVDREAAVLPVLKKNLAAAVLSAPLLQADLRRLPWPPAVLIWWSASMSSTTAMLPPSGIFAGSWTGS